MLIAEGVLSFTTYERRSDRYGAVLLYAGRIPNRTRPPLPEDIMRTLIEAWDMAGVRHASMKIPKDSPLAQNDQWPTPPPVPWPSTLPLGRRGRLIAEVVANYPVGHPGDLVREIVPEPAAPGESVILGEGWLFLDTEHGARALGLRPNEPRKTDWLDPHQIYRVLWQRVRLHFQRIRGRS